MTFFILNNSLTNSIQQSFLEKIMSLGSEETLRILENPKEHYRVHNSPPLVPLLRQISSVHALPTEFFKIHFNIILPFMPRSFTLSLSLRFAHRNLYAPLFSLPYVLHSPPISSSWVYHSNNIWWGEQLMQLLVMKSSPVHCYLVSFRPKCLSHRPSEVETNFYTHKKQHAKLYWTIL